MKNRFGNEPLRRKGRKEKKEKSFTSFFGLLYKFTQLSREELAAMLGIDDEFRKTRMYQSIVQEGKLEAKLEAVPRFLALGLSVEQVAGALDLTPTASAASG